MGSKNVSNRTIRPFLCTYAPQVIRDSGKDSHLRDRLLGLCGLNHVNLTRQATIHNRVMYVSGRQATICLSMANSRAVSNGLLLLRTRINAAIVRRLIRFVRHAFIRRRSSALTDNRLPLNILFLSLIRATTRQHTFIRLFGPTMCFFSYRSRSSFVVSGAVGA